MSNWVTPADVEKVLAFKDAEIERLRSLYNASVEDFEKELGKLIEENERLRDLDQAWLNAEGEIERLREENDRLKKQYRRSFNVDIENQAIEAALKQE